MPYEIEIILKYMEQMDNDIHFAVAKASVELNMEEAELLDLYDKWQNN